MGNKEYSPTRCVFILPKTNTFLCDRKALRGDNLIGVTKLPNGLFKATCLSKCLGTYHTELEAHQVWKLAKHNQANYLSQFEDDLRVKEALQNRYIN